MPIFWRVWSNAGPTPFSFCKETLLSGTSVVKEPLFVLNESLPALCEPLIGHLYAFFALCQLLEFYTALLNRFSQRINGFMSRKARAPGQGNTARGHRIFKRNCHQVAIARRYGC